ncbi:hypothetical protein [Saccharicrinis sp. GN24d3]
MDTIENDKARFDTRLPKEQKELFEGVAMLGIKNSYRVCIIYRLGKSQ